MNRLSHAADGTFGFVTLGGAVTVNANMVLNVAAIEIGSANINSAALAAAYTASTVTVSASDPTNPRLDLVWVNSSGAVAVAAGTPAAITTSTGPVPPTIGATGIELAMILVGAGVTAITANDIIDRRQLIAPSPFDGIRRQFRTTIPRRLLAEWSTAPYQVNDSLTYYSPSGIGTNFMTGGSAAGVVTALLLEWYSACTTGSATGALLGSALSNANATGPTLVTATAPNKSPRMLLRYFPGASNANLTTTMAGFFATLSATGNGAYLRANATGNLEFVTRQGTETVTSLGARPTALTSYEIFTEDAGVTWVCRNDTTGAIVATHTGTVPTVTTALGFGLYALSGSGSLNAFNPAYLRVEANSVA